MKKRIVSWLLVVVLLLGLMPTALAAAATLDSFFDGLPVIAETEPGRPSSTNKWKATELNGEDVLMSGNKGKSRSSSTLQLTFTGDTNLTFEYKVSSEKKYDKLNITLGSTKLVTDASGEVDWTGCEVEAKSGDVLTFVYEKDSSGDNGDDCVYVRNFSAGTPAIVTFHAGSGTGEDYTQKIYNGSGTLKANSFTCEGKVFAGWAASADSEDVVYSDGAKVSITDDTDLYAVWADAFTVTFVDGESSKTAEVAQNAAIGAVNIPDDPSKTGYRFDGWYNGEDKLTADTVISADTTFTAKWIPITYTIQFDKDASDAEGTVEPIEDVAYDADTTLPSAGFKRAGYTLNGWSSSTGSATGIYALGETVKKLTNREGAIVTLYAAWRGNDVAVTVDPNYAGAQTAARTGTVGSNYNYNKQENGTFKFEQIADPTRTGYIFTGWFDAAEGGTEITNQYKFTAEDALNGKTLYAHWEAGITVHFDGNGYDNPYSTLADKTVKKDKVFNSLPYMNSSYYPAGKALDGWYIKNADGSFGAAVTKDTDFSALSEVTLIAKWRDYQYVIKYNLKYSDKPSVTGTMADQTAPFGQDVKLAKCAYQRSGYDFAGWATNSYSSKVEYADEATLNRAWEEDDWGDGSEDGESFNLYAMWTEAKSDAEKTADAKLTAAQSAIDGTYNCTWGKDTNALTMISAKLTAAGITDVTVAMKEAAYSSMNYVGVAADGTLQYKWNENGSTPAASGSVRPTVVLSYNDGTKTYTKESTACLFYMGLDENKAREALKTVADRIAATIPQTVEQASDLTALQKYPLKAGVDASAVDYDKTDDLELWATAAWTSNNTAVISIANNGAKLFAPYTVGVSLPDSDTSVVLTLSLGYNGRDDLSETRVFTITVKGSKQTPSVDYQKLLEDSFGAPGALYDPATGAAIDKSAVVSDIHFPTTKDLKIDGKFTPILITSSSTDVIESADIANTARLAVYRPLPGSSDASVTLTVKILDRPSGEGSDYASMKTLAKLEIPVTVKALTQGELDSAAAFMQKVCTENVYWEGIRNANTDKNAIRGDLRSFTEIVPDGDGYKFIRTADDAKGVGVKADSIDGWYDAQQYRAFRSSIPAVIQSENLLIARDAADSTKLVFPTYNTPVKIDSVLTHAVYGKYYEKFKDNAAYAQFAKFYKQPVQTVVTVTGTTGKADPASEITVRVSIDGSAFDVNFTDTTGSFTCDSGAYKSAADAVLAVLAEKNYSYTGTPGYITSVTDVGGVTLEAGADKHGPWSGWMFTVNGTQPEVKPGWGATLEQYLLQANDVIRFYYVNCPTTDGNHVHGSEPATIIRPATHTRAGEQQYTCAVCGGTVKEAIPMTQEHTWGDVSYAWSTDNTTCTATRTCTANDGGVETETVNAVYAVVTAPTATATGLGRWTATFENAAFAVQTQDVTLPATGGNSGSGSSGSTGSVGKPSRRTQSDAQTSASRSERFDDVKQNSWYRDAVDFVAENGIMGGTDANTFSPNAAASRAMLVTVLHRMAGTPAAAAAHGFTDLARGAWYADAVAWAKENGIVDGVGNARFAPNAAISREQLAAILYRYAQYCGLDVTADAAALDGFADAAGVSAWARDAMRWAVTAGLISGRSASALAPQSGATRAELAQLLMKFASLSK